MLSPNCSTNKDKLELAEHEPFPKKNNFSASLLQNKQKRKTEFKSSPQTENKYISNYKNLPPIRKVKNLEYFTFCSEARRWFIISYCHK